MEIFILGILGAAVGAVVAELTVGWTYKSWWDGHTELNEDAIIYVVIGLAVGILIGCLIRIIVALNDKKVQTSANLEEISKLKTLLDNGTITQEEFDEKKKQLLNL